MECLLWLNVPGGLAIVGLTGSLSDAQLGLCIPTTGRQPVAPKQALY